MYYPQEPQEPSGCGETIVITCIIARILLVPMLAIFGVIFGIMLTFFALTVHPLLGLLVLLLIGGLIAGMLRYEAAQSAKLMRHDDD